MTNHASRYNGHKNWQFWNVSLWINNDEALYNMARKHLQAHGGRHGGNKSKAAIDMLDELQINGIDATLDGAKYTVPAIRAAMEGM